MKPENEWSEIDPLKGGVSLWLIKERWRKQVSYHSLSGSMVEITIQSHMLN
jgi:hypothetical protein